MKEITLKDLSKVLKLSTSTISKALSNSNEISDQTKDRVKSLASFYGYRPNQLARKLKDGKTRCIGIVVPNVLDDFFSLVVHAIEEEAKANGLHIILCLSHDESDKEEQYLSTLMSGMVDLLSTEIPYVESMRCGVDFDRPVTNCQSSGL